MKIMQLERTATLRLVQHRKGATQKERNTKKGAI